MDILDFNKYPVVGILRGIKEDVIEPLVECVISAGLKNIEITMNTDGADVLINKMVKASGGRLNVGAGTVLNLDDLNKALCSGAEFIVSPILVDDVVKSCVKNKIPVFPGAFTPQEIFKAAEAGATMVKVFPSKFFGPSYLKEVKAPLNKIKLFACGGVNKNNIKEFFDCGADAVAFGASIFKKERFLNKDFSAIEEDIRALLSEI
ncbi:MAG: bifunctional 4-hydroxy-2-oxoglutarate aldolase/2-dehydro-3-deoxy-phosphogluconate aldolase [Candidatus Zapsychrus exili]|nr:bifunctional 4-hydroxy-2-oxoglutarate aldolase/2-dehydro-3-deoxy-phosphogluconate aldolase [Candidatus Zapsychrus exili]